MPDKKIREINLKQPNPILVRQLKNMLKDAEAGDIIAIVGATYYHDGHTSDHWVEVPKGYSFGIFGDRMIGCLERCQHKMMTIRLGVDIPEDQFYVDPRNEEDEEDD